MIQAVLIRDLGVVEPRAIASLPGASTKHAELGTTSTSHVVASFLQFDHGSAVGTALPALFFGHVD